MICSFSTLLNLCLFVRLTERNLTAGWWHGWAYLFLQCCHERRFFIVSMPLFCSPEYQFNDADLASIKVLPPSVVYNWRVYCVCWILSNYAVMLVAALLIIYPNIQIKFLIVTSKRHLVKMALNDAVIHVLLCINMWQLWDVSAYSCSLL